MMKAMAAFLISLALASLVFAQDATESATSVPLQIAGNYLVDGLNGASAETMTIAGTGPVYTVAFKEGSTYYSREPADLLVQGNVGISDTVPSEYCSPATLLRQSDGTLFGWWIDTDIGPTALSFEHYVPRGQTTDFVGTYDLVGSYPDGAQYKGSVEITKDGKVDSYHLNFQFSADEEYADFAPRGRGLGLVSGNVLGYSITFENAVTCSVSLYTFRPDGGIDGRFDLVASNGKFTGTRQ